MNLPRQLSKQECQEQILAELLKRNGIRATDSPATMALKFAGHGQVNSVLDGFITKDIAMLETKE